MVRRLVISGSTLAIGGTAVLLLAPSGFGQAGGLSTRVYEETVGAVDGGPGWLVDAGGHAAVAGLLVLAGLLAWTGWRAGAPAIAAAALVVGGAVVSYLVSEGTKLVVDEERPCRALTGVTTWAHCPPVGDWSFPSNHATVAGALAVGVVLLARRLALLAVPLALTVAGMRVVTGVHYPHDVLAGLVLGAAITAAVLVALGPLTSRLARPGARTRVPVSASG